MTVLLISIIILIGFDSIINSALLFTNLFRSDTKINNVETEEVFYGSVSIDTPSVATNSASIIVSGQATGFDSVDYYLNNVKSESSSLDKSTVFSSEIGKLKIGENILYAVARTKDGNNSKKTEKFTVIYKRDAPSLQIDKPKNEEIVHSQEVEISGTTDRNTTIHLNNAPIVVDLKGDFVTSTKLKEGDNTLNFKATDVAGNTSEKSIHIVYQSEE
ncbi:hypothetical protein COY16_00580 [Candidatus Roizmanbacteria bacterium CG_4_10_14_0_2_um_filter_39_13]|uniref:Bacterial Ig-like domain-containing protein n=1 Tax=Candidatus Roizmanbacteria bacterium CG_4_10_14_0_2_um_filter_39_13 TaxID=1974825 RepID=A0A2M7U1I7_9BACT|nr:MAG: hypothetical protein COY16_00580 [Candidatus Roizmanbacteria bacterium CG_4_10_14_0_2_um_filter_39_13]